MIEKIVVNKKQCESCPFSSYSYLKIERMGEIYTYLANGTNHMCHSTFNETVCRGGRDFQLKLFHRRGFIDSPTDEALDKAMIEMKIK